MMMSPEIYYETRIKGKSLEEIQEEIETLEADIKHQKEIIKNTYSEKALTMPSPKTTAKVEKEYLKIAKKAYQDLELIADRQKKPV